MKPEISQRFPPS